MFMYEVVRCEFLLFYSVQLGEARQNPKPFYQAKASARNCSSFSRRGTFSPKFNNGNNFFKSTKFQKYFFTSRQPWSRSIQIEPLFMTKFQKLISVDFFPRFCAKCSYLLQYNTIQYCAISTAQFIGMITLFSWFIIIAVCSLLFLVNPNN